MTLLSSNLKWDFIYIHGKNTRRQRVKVKKKYPKMACCNANCSLTSDRDRQRMLICWNYGKHAHLKCARISGRCFDIISEGNGIHSSCVKCPIICWNFLTFFLAGLSSKFYWICLININLTISIKILKLKFIIGNPGLKWQATKIFDS